VKPKEIEVKPQEIDDATARSVAKARAADTLVKLESKELELKPKEIEEAIDSKGSS